MTGEGETGEADTPDGFRTALADLKRRGSSLLVVGAVPRESYLRASRKMLGAADADPPRRRLVVMPDADATSGGARLEGTGPLDPRYARVVTCSGVVRGGTATAPQSGDASGATPPSPDGADADPTASGKRRAGPRVRTVACEPGEVGAAVTEVVDQFEAAAGGLAPAELRVGFDCLPTLLSAYDLQTAFAFLGVFGWQVRAAGGMGHVRLPRAYDDRTVRTLAPLFDAVIELRVAGRRLEQRWHLRDEDVVSGWLPTVEEEGPRLDD
ncbi:MAG: hypothetical protein ABEJ61_08345 [Haloferacaceae archaeon]